MKAIKSIDYTSYANTLLLSWFFIAIVAFDQSIATSTLLILSFIFIIPTVRNLDTAWLNHGSWIMALGFYGLTHIVFRILDGSSDISSYERPFRFILAIVLFLYLLHFGFKESWLHWAILLGTLFGVGFAIHEAFWLNKSRADLGHNAIAYATLMTTLGLITTCIAWIKEKLSYKLIFLGTGLLAFFAVILSGTRGAVLSWIFFFSLLTLLFILRSKSPKKKLGVVFFSAIVLILATQLPQVQMRWQQTKWEFQQFEQGNSHTSTGLRVQMWHTAWFLGKRSPILGSGQDLDVLRELSHDFIYENNYHPDLLSMFDHFHNEYMDSFAKRGLLGVFAWLGLLIGAMYSLKGRYLVASSLVVATYSIGALTETLMSTGRLIYLYIFLISVIRCAATQSKLAKDT
ncbi:O-antigen ligase family protein [Nitrincola tapanii]|uniref:O-antigen ligase family protein n=1 Tax=Nitrincola tapanii TaxID=1708751 RepID=A0A5A9W1B0_9GAMM|nr:O-antigen ligase family protein [Nitrincola tapanii]KAA0874362.1 O-antigen ligase family protein [Nitrincola tapanii]